jgi:hypothetical protein
MATRAKNPDGTTRYRTDQLARAVYDREKWPTPQAADATRRGGDFARRSRIGSGGDDLSTAVRESVGREPGTGLLNPKWVEWLMGFPLGWTDLDASETP